MKNQATQIQVLGNSPRDTGGSAGARPSSHTRRYQPLLHNSDGNKLFGDHLHKFCIEVAVPLPGIDSKRLRHSITF